jgi:hypothetical protein
VKPQNSLSLKNGSAACDLVFRTGIGRQRRKAAAQAIADFESSKTLARAREAVELAVNKHNIEPEARDSNVESEGPAAYCMRLRSQADMLVAVEMSRSIGRVRSCVRVVGLVPMSARGWVSS